MKKLLLAVIAISISFTLYAQEDITLTTYFPTPVGDFIRLKTQGDTALATGGGTVTVGSNTNSANLDVNGFLRLRPMSEPANPQPGTLYYDSALNILRYWNGSNWIQFTSPAIAKGTAPLPLTADGSGFYCSAVTFPAGLFTNPPEIALSVKDDNSTGTGGNSCDSVEITYKNVTTAGCTVCGRSSTSVSGGWDAYPEIYWIAIEP